MAHRSVSTRASALATCWLELVRAWLQQPLLSLEQALEQLPAV